MNRITTVLSCVLALGCVVLEESRAAGFDCQTASTAIEKAICAVPSLNDADERLARLYERAVASDAGGDITDEQTAWKKVRDTCPDEACIASMYADHIAMLTAMVDPRETPRTSPVLLLPALDETLPTDIVAPIDTASRRVSASAVGTVESDHDEAGNRFTLVDLQGGRIPLSDLWDLSDAEQDALAALEGQRRYGAGRRIPGHSRRRRIGRIFTQPSAGHLSDQRREAAGEIHQEHRNRARLPGWFSQRPVSTDGLRRGSRRSVLRITGHSEQARRIDRNDDQTGSLDRARGQSPDRGIQRSIPSHRGDNDGVEWKCAVLQRQAFQLCREQGRSDDPGH